MFVDSAAGTISRSRMVHTVYMHSVNGSNEFLFLSTGRPKPDLVRDCVGQFEYNECYYSSAIAQYDVRITNDTIQRLDYDAALHPRIIARANNTAVTDMTAEEHGLQNPIIAYGQTVTRTTLAGILALTAQQYWAEGALIPNPNGQSPTLLRWPFYVNPKMAWFGFDHMTNYAEVS